MLPTETPLSTSSAVERTRRIRLRGRLLRNVGPVLVDNDVHGVRRGSTLVREGRLFLSRGVYVNVRGSSSGNEDSGFLSEISPDAGEVVLVVDSRGSVGEVYLSSPRPGVPGPVWVLYEPHSLGEVLHSEDVFDALPDEGPVGVHRELFGRVRLCEGVEGSVL